MAGGARTRSNSRLAPPKLDPPEDKKGRTSDSIYDELIEDFLEAREQGRKFLVVAPHLLVQEKKSTSDRKTLVQKGRSTSDRKTVETMRMMLNGRLEKWPIAGTEDTENLRPEVKVRGLLLTERVLARYAEHPELFEGYEVGEKAVLIEVRDKVKDPYDGNEKNIAKRLGETVPKAGTSK